jgi:phosphopantothenoylcysteine decarboxylase/phosphopantothenate--cysteine ligase
MYEAVMSHIQETQIYIGAAAVADYRPLNAQHRKIKKNNDTGIIELQKNIDIVAAVANLKPKPFTVGFAAETDDLEAYAKKKLHSKNLDMIAANWVGRAEGGFESDNNALQVYWHGGEQFLTMSGKQRLAEQLISLIAKQFNLTQLS